MGWIGPAITGAASLGGAAIGGKGANKAAQTQLTASREALAFEREKEAARQKQYEQGLAAWSAGRRLLAARYGLNPEEVMPPGSIGAPAAAGPAAGPPAAGGNIRDLLMARNEGVPQDIGAWSDWARYGLG